MFDKGANIITYYEITIYKREEHTMDYRQEFSKLMAETSDLALATVSGDAPNVAASSAPHRFSSMCFIAADDVDQ